MSFKKKTILSAIACVFLFLGGVQYYGEALVNQYVRDIQANKLESLSRDRLATIYTDGFGVLKIFIWSVPFNELARNDAFFARQKSDIPTALNIFRSLGQAEQNKKSAKTEEMALTYFDIAQTLYRAKDYSNAVNNHKWCLKKMPKNVECRRELERLYTFMVLNSIEGDDNNLINRDGNRDGDLQSLGKDGQGRSGKKGAGGI